MSIKCGAWTTTLASIAIIVADECIQGVRKATDKFICNYEKRRDVGFGSWNSITGSFNETKHYFIDTLNGDIPKEYKKAIEFTSVENYRH